MQRYAARLEHYCLSAPNSGLISTISGDTKPLPTPTRPEPWESGTSSVRPPAVVIGARRLRIEDVLQVPRGRAALTLSQEPEFVRRIKSGADYLARLLAGNAIVYGVNTGYGDSCTVSIRPISLPNCRCI